MQSLKVHRRPSSQFLLTPFRLVPGLISLLVTLQFLQYPSLGQNNFIRNEYLEAASAKKWNSTSLLSALLGNNLASTANIMVRTFTEVAACDPSVYGYCCFAESLCHSEARCYSPASTSILTLAVNHPRCICRDGFEGDGRNSGTGCTNIDECASGEAKCQQVCVDMAPGYQCGCYPGYRLVGDPYHCVDIDECAEGAAACAYSCKNVEGSYECECPAGKELAEDKQTCVDINECLTNHGKGPCAEICENTDGGYRCGCPAGLASLAACSGGYKLNPLAPTKCIDRNECLEGLAPDGRTACAADGSQLCINHIGSYECVCNTGYTKVTDDFNTNRAVDLPLRKFDLKDIALVGSSYSNQYLKQDERNLQVTDSHLAMSHPFSSSSNTLGKTDKILASLSQQMSYNNHNIRESNVNAALLAGQSVIGILAGLSTVYNSAKRIQGAANAINFYNEKENAFHISEGKGAVKIKESIILSDAKFHSGVFNKNSVAEYDSSSTKNGSHKRDAFTSDKTSLGMERYNSEDFVASEVIVPQHSLYSNLMCKDIDECQELSHNSRKLVCESIDQQCVNTPGSYECRCPVGFELSETTWTCVDINECDSLTHANPCAHRCLNSVGSYACSCDEGFKLTADGQCEDIDECVDGTHECQFGCVNIIGGYYCICPNGYTLLPGGKGCEDLNECLTNPCSHRCLNTEGSFICLCPSDFILRDDKVTCQPKDDCLADPTICQENSECKKNEFSDFYECQCQEGYRNVSMVDTLVCEDINECVEGGSTGFPCKDERKPCCENRDGGFICTSRFRLKVGRLNASACTAEEAVVEG